MYSLIAINFSLRTTFAGWVWFHMSIIPATWRMEIGRITVGDQTEQKY
jgi:hypothetical protein